MAKSKHEFNSAMIGWILGDGTMPNESQLYIRHGGRQLKLVDEKVAYLSSYIYPKSIRSAIDKKGYPYRYAYYNTPRLKYLYKLIYQQKRKTISPTLIHRFNTIALACFYIDDGSLCLRGKRSGLIKSREVYLATHSFTESEVHLFQSMLKTKFGIDFRLTWDKGKPRLWCNTDNAKRFVDTVKTFVEHFPSVHYKLDFRYKRESPYNFFT